MLDNLKSAAANTAKRTAFGFAAGLCLLVGLVFMTIAAWIALVSIADALTAALVLGAVFIGLGLIFLAFALTRRSESPVYHEAFKARAEEPSKVGANSIIGAFFEGLGAGLTARDQFSSRRDR